MEYAYGILKSVHSFYTNINPATLTGAIDVIVVEQADGTYISTPFHVRFGKYGVLHSREKVVDILINGDEIDIKMKLGENGEAFFVEELENDDLTDANLSTSPLPNQGDDIEMRIREGIRSLKKHQKEELRSRTEKKRRQGLRSCSRSLSRSPSAERKDASFSSDLQNQSTFVSPRRALSLPTIDTSVDQSNDVHLDNVDIVSDSDLPLVVHRRKSIINNSNNSNNDNNNDEYGHLLESAVSDSEVGRCQLVQPSIDVDVTDWKWGQFPGSPADGERPKLPAKTTSSSGWTWFGWRRERNRPETGIYLEDLEKGIRQDPSFTVKYLGKGGTRARSRGEDRTDVQQLNADSVDDGPNVDAVDELNQNQPEEDGRQHDPGYVTGGSDLGSIPIDAYSGGRTSPWSFDINEFLEDCAFSYCESDLSTITEEQFEECKLSFEQFFCDPLSASESQHLIMRIAGRYYPRSIAYAMLISLICFRRPLSQEIVDKLMDEYREKTLKINRTVEPGSSWFLWPRRTGSMDQENAGSNKPESAPLIADDTQKLICKKGMQLDAINDQPQTSSLINEQKEPSNSAESHKYQRSLRLNSAQLKTLGLLPGMNEARFSVTTRFQGTSWCRCHVYLYNWSDKLVVSDIDGTITKSDVLGHVLPAIGGTWAHAGVAQLFTRIKLNGYKIVYLSSRALGQSHYTKSYLQSLAQDQKMLPNGPVLLSPASLLSAFRKEVIERRPEEFKIAALTDLRELFPSKKPFFAGFGNRETDVISYKAVGIADERILTVDPAGQVRRADSIGFVSSYECLAMDVVDYLFPPLVKKLAIPGRNSWRFSKPQTCSHFTYWRRSSTSQLDNASFVDYERK